VRTTRKYVCILMFTLVEDIFMNRLRVLRTMNECTLKAYGVNVGSRFSWLYIRSNTGAYVNSATNCRVLSKQRTASLGDYELKNLRPCVNCLVIANLLHT
jgi:hypothetical protein